MNRLTSSLIAFLLSLALHVHAQEDLSASAPTSLSRKPSSKDFGKGSFISTLNASGSLTNGFQHSGRTWSLTPQIGYLAAHRLVVGLQFSLGKTDQTLKSGIPSSTVIPEYRLFSALPEIYSRYYLLDFRLKPFVQLSSGYNVQWGSEYTDGREASVGSQNFALSGAIGLNFRISRLIGLDALYNTRFDNNSQIIDANQNLRYRLGVSVSVR